jgi:RNA polymerase sigma-70 factor (ECF subfamily)
MPVEVPQHLITSVKGGDKRSFGILVDQCSQFVYSVAFKIVGNDDDARDVAQESFVKAWNKMQRYDSSYKFTTWLYRIVMNTCLDKVRKNGRERKIFKGMEVYGDSKILYAEDPASGLEEEQLTEFVRMISGRLSRKQHFVFVLHDLEDFTQDEISKILRMPKNRVKSNLCHARKAIRKMLEFTKEKIIISYEM